MASCTATACTANFTSSTQLEITVISAEDLRQGHRYLGRGAFVTVRSGPTIVSTTSSMEDAHGYPLWNECLQVKEPSHGGWLQVDINKIKPGDATSTPVHVAGAKVPLSDFSFGPVGYKHFLSYRLKDQDGRGNGIVNICVKKLGRSGENQFNGGAHVIGCPVGPVGVGYGYGYSAYGK